MENQQLAESPEPKPKRKYRKRRKRAKTKSPKPLAFLSPSPALDSSTDSEISSEPSGSEKFEQACAEVLADASGQEPENRIELADELEEGVPNPEFEKMAKVYLPKPFAILAYMFDDDAIALNKEQLEILVPECAMSLEEIWPFLPDWFTNSRFKHTLAFTFSLSFVAGENCLRAYKKTKAALSEKAQPDPHVSQSSTSTGDSPASSAMSPSPGGVRLI